MAQNLNKHDVELVASEYGWEYLEEQPANDLISFTNDDDDRFNVWLRKGTVGVAFYNPKKKKKVQAFRKNCDMAQLECIFKDPLKELT